MLATSDSLRKFYEKNSYALLKDANTLTELIVLAEFWEDVSNQDTERFSNRVLKRFFVLNYAPNGMWTYFVSVYFMQNKDDEGLLDDEKFYTFLQKITGFIWTYAITNPGVNALRTPVYAEMVNIVNDKPVEFSKYKFDADTIRSMFDNFSFNNARPITKAMIAWWAYQNDKQPLLSLETTFEIEHIYARNRNEKENSLTDARNVESLGNKALLEKRINIRASDYRFADKKKYYEGFTNSKGQVKEGSKLFCGIANWIGHLISDVSGSSSSEGRGMGIPSPIWTWSNDVIAIKAKLNIPVTEFDKSVNELALKLFEKGYDVRFQTTQAIPVFINEMVVRLLYSIRRLIGYYISVPKKDRSWVLLWKSCEPFSNATVKRMLTVAHGTFCIIDIGDATIRGFEKGIGSFNVVEFFMRLNIVGVGRFTISLYGEAKRGIQRTKANNEAIFMKREKVIIDDYMEGLKILSKTYNDKLLMTFVSDFKSSNAYKEAFNKSVELAKLRNVPENERIKSKADIDYIVC